MVNLVPGRSRIWFLLIFVAAALLQTPALAADRHVALVLGEADYATLPKLENTINDATAVRDSLTRIGFEVYFGENLSRIDTEELLKRYYRAADGASVALFYYAGHGIQLGGANYIVPVDAKLTALTDIQLQAMNVDDVLQYLRAHTSAQLIFLDACRSNPAPGRKYWVVDAVKTADQAQGLAGERPNVGSLIAYATAPGDVAYDGSGANSPFTSAFVSHVGLPNQEIRQMLDRVRRDVIAATEGKQVPWETLSLVDDIYLVHAPLPPSAQALTQVAIPAADAPAQLGIPLPRASTDAPLRIVVDQLPDKGRLMVGDKSLKAADAMGPEAFQTLTYDPSGLKPGATTVMSYAVSDPYGQVSRGVVAINVVPPSSASSDAADAAKSAQAEALDGYRKYVVGLDGLQRTVKIGVGPAPLTLTAFDSPAGSAADVSIARAPDHGLLWLGNRSLTVGTRVALADLGAIAFEPKIGSDAQQPDSFSLALVGDVPATAQIAIKPDVDSCDEEAGAPFDLQGVTAGKLPNEIDAAKAIAACQTAVAAYPNVGRFRFELGRGYLAASDLDKAKQALNDAAQRKHLRATAALAGLEQLGAFGPANAQKAAQLYASCSAAGDVYCVFAYGKQKFYGDGTAKDQRAGLELMIRAAELGHTFAMNELGFVFTNGKNVPADVERGLTYYQAGADRNDIYSLNDLGLVYWRGNGRPVDLEKARDFFQRAADGGQPYAPTNLGTFYRDGLGVPKDIDQAKTWFELGAKRGDYWGALSRGRLSLDEPGQGADAARWLALAGALNVNRGNSDPQGQAVKLLAGVAEADKRTTLAALQKEAGDASAPPPASQLNARLIAVSDKLWRGTKPRFDLF